MEEISGQTHLQILMFFVMPPFCKTDLTMRSQEAQQPTMDNNHNKFEQNPTSSYGGVLQTNSCAQTN
jgi:hypothetical protein